MVTLQAQDHPFIYAIELWSAVILILTRCSCLSTAALLHRMAQPYAVGEAFVEHQRLTPAALLPELGHSFYT